MANAVQSAHKLVRVAVGRDPRVLRFQTPVLRRGLPPTHELLQRCADVLRQTAREARELLETPRAQA